MLFIIETTSVPATFQVDINSQFQPGMLAQLNKDKTCGISDGTAPIGIIDDVRTKGDDTTLGTNQITVWTKDCVIKTDQFEPNAIYPTGSNLYCSEAGRFTTIRPSPKRPCIGSVLGVEGNSLTLNFFGSQQESQSATDRTNMLSTLHSHLQSQSNKRMEKNLQWLIALLQIRLVSTGKTKSTDQYGNTIYVDTNIFSAEQLEAFIHLAVSSFNQTPPYTSFMLDNDSFVSTFADILVEAATLSALASQSIIEKGREYQVPDNGITITPKLADLLANQYATLLPHHQIRLKDIKTAMRLSTDTGKFEGRKRYKTTKPHGKFPANTECWASRTTDRTIILEYDDGTKIELGGDWFLLGNELPKPGAWVNPETTEKVIEQKNSLTPLLMLGGVLLGGLLTAANKTPTVRVVEEQNEEEPEDAETISNQNQA